MEFTGERFIPDPSNRSELAIEHMQRYLSVAEVVKDKVVVDIACGEGYGSSILADYANRVFGIDIDKQAIRHASRNYPRENLTFMQGTVDNIPVETSSIDIVVSFETIEHVTEEAQRSFLQEVKRVLRRDGLFIVSTPNKAVYSDLHDYRNPYHLKEFYRDEFLRFLNGYFAEIKIYEQEFRVSSFIANLESKKLKIVSDEGPHNEDGKYMIAICGSDPDVQRIDIGSVVFETDIQYEALIQRIVDLQDEVEGRNDHVKKLDSQIESLSRRIVQLQNEVEARNDHVKKLDSQIESFLGRIVELQNEVEEKNRHIRFLDTQIESLLQGGEAKFKVQQDHTGKMIEYLDSEREPRDKDYTDESRRLGTCVPSQIYEQELSIEEKDTFIIQRLSDEVANLKTTIENQRGHIEQLLERERFLENILRSQGWRLLLGFYKIRDVILPNNARFYLQLLYRACKDPRLLRRMLSANNLKKFIHYKKTGMGSALPAKLMDYVERHTEEEPPKPLKLFGDGNSSERLVFPVADNPTVSIIIPVFNQWNYTFSCLRSILENTTDVSYEIIVADDLSTDETVDLSKYVENVKFIRDGVNRGFLLNCNHAAKTAAGEFILFLNNDTNVQPNWLSSLVSLIRNNASIGMVGAKLIYKDGRLQEAGGIIWNDATGWNYGRLDDPEKPEYNYVKKVDYISGACIMIRTELWREIGGFDERYAPAYFEDSDLAFEVRNRGYDVVYQPKAVVVHFEGVSHGTDLNTGIKSFQEKNRQKFIEKWAQTLRKEHFSNGQHVFMARERSRFQKTILVIDHYVPHYDKDAGSRTVYQYLKLFVNMGLNVKFIGDNLYKHEPYTTQLQGLGIEVLYGHWYEGRVIEWLKKNGTYINYVYLNRPHISVRYIDYVRRYTQATVLYYGHDLHYLRERREYELSGNPSLLKSSEKWHAVEMELFRKSDVVYYPSQVEVDVVKEESPSVRVRAIPAYLFDDIHLKNINQSFNQRQNILFVGGFNHKPNVDGIIWFVERVLPHIVIDVPEVKLYIVGSNPPEVVMNLHSPHIIVTGYVPDEELETYYQACRLVVVPLRYGAGVKGKVVEALYHNVPIVTTTVGAEGLRDAHEYMIIRDGEEAFAQSVIDLYCDLDRLEDISRKSNGYVQNYFTPTAAWRLLESDIIM